MTRKEEEAMFLDPDIQPYLVTQFIFEPLLSTRAQTRQKRTAERRLALLQKNPVFVFLTMENMALVELCLERQALETKRNERKAKKATQL